MPRWELCRIERRVRDQKSLMSSRRFLKWVAVVDTSQGEKVIDQTVEIEDKNTIDVRQWGEFVQHHQSALVGRLLAQGWEPLGENQFKRQVP